MLKVKFYDKMLDLLGREHNHIVGSRASKILDVANRQDLLQKRIRQFQSVGLTRLEVSILHEAIEKFNPLKPPVRTLCHQKIEKAIEHMVTNILNSDLVL